MLETIASKKDMLDDPNSTLFQDLRQRNNETFKGVGHTREGTTDAVITSELAHAVLKRSEKLNDLSRRIHFDDFAQCLAKMFRFQGKFCWRSLGQDVGKLFLRPTPMVTMLGSMELEEKVRVAQKLRVPREKLVEVRPEELIQESKKDADGKEIDEEELNEATFARITRLDRKLDELTKQQQTNMLTMLVDERDHVQTVENFFDFSFLVKDKKVEFTEDADIKQPKARHSHNMGHSVSREAQQLVLSLNMKDVKRLAAALSEQGNECPLHRTDELYDALNAKEQSNLLATQVAEKLKKSEALKAERRTQKSQASQGASQRKRG
jgi:hypothetical protein